MAGLKAEIPSTVQGHDLAAHLSGKASKVKAPKGVLYIRNVDGDVNEKEEVLNYFPVARGIKTDRYTLAITIDRDKQVKEILLFDDKKDPYQMHPLDASQNKSLMKRLTGQMKALLKQANDPWYRENILGMGE